MKWFLLLIWDPVAALDLVGDDGKLDHGKIIGFWTFTSILAVLVLYVVGVGQLLPLGHTIALISTAYGWAGWRTFLKARSALVEQKQDAVVEMMELDESADQRAEPDLFTDDESDPPKGPK
jgi:hypothetical protein